jgi:hypothetical protein
MKLFVQVAFDLDSSNPKYKEIETLLGQIYLSKTFQGEKLPANTFAGILEFPSTVAAIEHVVKQFKLTAQFDLNEGRALITAVPAEQAKHTVFNFGR